MDTVIPAIIGAVSGVVLALALLTIGYRLGKR